MLVDRNGLWPEWASKALAIAAIGTIAVVSVVAVVATAGAASVAVGAAATTYGTAAFGATAGATIGTVATYATTATAATTAAFITVSASSDMAEVVTGENYVCDTLFRGNRTDYEFYKGLSYVAAAGYYNIGSLYQNYAPPSNHYERNDESPYLRISDSQLGVKWGKHRSDYKGILNNHNDYIEYADYIFNSPDKIVYDYRNHEYYYISGDDLLRVNENYEFISLYPGANTKRVLDAIDNGGVLR